MVFAAERLGNGEVDLQEGCVHYTTRVCSVCKSIEKLGIGLPLNTLQNSVDHTQLVIASNTAIYTR